MTKKKNVIYLIPKITTIGKFIGKFGNATVNIIARIFTNVTKVSQIVYILYFIIVF